MDFFNGICCCAKCNRRVCDEINKRDAQLAAANAQRDELLRAAIKVSNTSPRTSSSNERDLDHYDACTELGIVIERIARAQSGQPDPVQQPSTDDVAIQGGECAFFDELPKGPSIGRFSDSERAELDDLKRKAFKAGES